MALDKKWLIESMEQSKLLCIHLDASDTSRFIVGTVMSLTEDWMLVSLVDRSGRFDGLLLTRVSLISRLSRGGPYYEQLSLLAEHNSVQLSLISVCEPIEVLEMLQESRRSAWFYDLNDGITKGFVSDHDRDFTEIEVYTSALQFEGFELMRIEDIVRIEFGGPDQRLLDSSIHLPDELER
jgi:hypothetical protein